MHGVFIDDVRNVLYKLIVCSLFFFRTNATNTKRSRTKDPRCRTFAMAAGMCGMRPNAGIRTVVRYTNIVRVLKS